MSWVTGSCDAKPDGRRMSEFEERFTNAILNFCAGKTYPERMQLIAGILTAFGNLEAAGDNSRVARVLFDAATQIEKSGREP